MRIDVQFVNSLTDGDALNEIQKLEVARQVGLSETVFVSKSEIATIKLDFFTPTRQIAHCGHATIATFSLLRRLGKVADGWLTKETVDKHGAGGFSCHAHRSQHRQPVSHHRFARRTVCRPSTSRFSGNHGNQR